MGLLKGSLTASRYLVRGNMPDNFWPWLNLKISQNIFLDIEGAAQERSLGWVSAHDYFDTAFAYESYNLNPYVVLGIRLDRRHITATLVRKYHRLEIARAKSVNPEARISKAERENLKEKARLQLLTRIPPQTSFWEMCWNTQSGQLWFITGSRPHLLLSEELFAHSFAPLQLEPVIPYNLALSLSAAEQKDALQFLSPLNGNGQI
jgi:hypothetical protein